MLVPQADSFIALTDPVAATSVLSPFVGAAAFGVGLAVGMALWRYTRARARAQAEALKAQLAAAEAAREANADKLRWLEAAEHSLREASQVLASAPLRAPGKSLTIETHEDIRSLLHRLREKLGKVDHKVGALESARTAAREKILHALAQLPGGRPALPEPMVQDPATAAVAVAGGGNGDSAAATEPEPDGRERATEPEHEKGSAKRKDRSRKRKRFWRVVLTHVGQVRGALLFAAGCAVAGAAMDLLKPWPIKILLDHGLDDRPLPGFLWFLEGLTTGNRAGMVFASAAGAVLITLIGAAFGYFEKYLTTAIGYRLVYALRRELFSHLQRLSLAFHNRARSGDLLSRLAGDANTLKDILSDFVLKLGTEVLNVGGTFIMMFAVDWRAGLIAVATVPPLTVTQFLFYRRTKKSARAQRRQEGNVASRMNEVLAAIPLVQAFAREGYEQHQFDTVTSKTLEESIRLSRLSAAASRSSGIITALGRGAAVVYCGLRVIHGTMSPGELVLLLSYLGDVYKPIRELAKLSIDFSKVSASAERIAEILDIEPDIEDRPDAIEAPRFEGEIIFDGVSFDYGDGKDVLRNVSFAVAPGQRVALVGQSGAGKSTIASLMLRLYEPQAGAILIDGADMRRYRRESFRRHIGVVLQQSILFGATVKENIAYGKPEATMAEIVAAAKAANADEFIRQLEDGYDAVIGERGATLSGGQRQRISIARALIRNAPILILDEPMTGLDAENEANVREALDRLMEGKTCIMITHDLQAIADADQVLVLEDGQLIEWGTHTELMANSPRYQQMYESDLGEAAVEAGA